jgi:1-deoxyxylulose-5-phosphate synthase
MKYVQLGTAGAQVSNICLGCMSFGNTHADWGLDYKQSHDLMTRAIDLGINFFDTADAYGFGEGEEFLGRTLREIGVARTEVVIATKVFAPMSAGPNQRGLSRKHIFQSVDDSLRRLGTDYIDLYQIHRFDYTTPLEETIDALGDLVRSGKVLYLGAGSMLAYQLAKYRMIAGQRLQAKFVMLQNHYNLLYREEEREMVPLCLEEGVGMMPWSPMAGGLLAGRKGPTKRSESTLFQKRYGRPSALSVLGARAEDQEIINSLHKIAEERGESPAQVAIAWLLSKPAVTAPIVGATKAEQLDDTARAAHTTLSSDEIAMLEAPYQPRAVSGPHAPSFFKDHLSHIKMSDRENSYWHEAGEGGEANWRKM